MTPTDADPQTSPGLSPPPLLVVERGNPTEAEVAAAIALIAARSGRPADDEPDLTATSTAGWAAKPNLMRPAVVVGPGGWRAAARPR